VTPRLVLRPLVATDTTRVALLAGDPAVARFLDRVPSPFPVALAGRWIAQRDVRWRQGRGMTFAIATAEDADRLLGTVSLRVTMRRKRAELGYWLGTEAWGHGYATEATRAVVDWGFAQLGLHRIDARVHADNPASLRIVAKHGFTVDRVRRRFHRRGLDLIDVVFLGIARETWLAPAT
jgi:RimJ/RimL family protein N-acetyltransferase